jgi:hypothetical protein
MRKKIAKSARSGNAKFKRREKNEKAPVPQGFRNSFNGHFFFAAGFFAAAFHIYNVFCSSGFPRAPL